MAGIGEGMIIVHYATAERRAKQVERREVGGNAGLQNAGGAAEAGCSREVIIGESSPRRSVGMALRACTPWSTANK